MTHTLGRISYALIISLGLFSCRKDNGVAPEEVIPLDTQKVTTVNGLYVLNEGNWGSNKASLDYYDYGTGNYRRNIYGEANPEATLGLGDVGNDIKIYGSRLYVVVNASNKVEVLDIKTAKRIGKIDIPNCRYVSFYKGNAYVSSYEGYVSVIDTASITETAKITVGRQPEEMAVVGNKLYVANSGGYDYPDYDNTVSVVDLSTHKEIKKIEVAINLHRLKADEYGDIYVTSRGDYFDIKSNLYVIDSRTDVVKKAFNVPAGNLTIHNDYAYIYSLGYDSNWNTVVSYAKINVKDETIADGNFITDGTDANIRLPYGIAIDPVSEDIYVTDAKDYVSPGTLYCFDKNGKKKFEVTTGDIPAHLVFYTNNN